mmetsp:Transcript_9279/g.17697  ORF Transcript_9279/g.17697 Transcript_9279/m.17697 type:complete len:603 (+) Transcript_9279:56-1864(+)
MKYRASERGKGPRAAIGLVVLTLLVVLVTWATIGDDLRPSKFRTVEIDSSSAQLPPASAEIDSYANGDHQNSEPVLGSSQEVENSELEIDSSSAQLPPASSAEIDSSADGDDQNSETVLGSSQVIENSELSKVEPDESEEPTTPLVLPQLSESTESPYVSSRVCESYAFPDRLSCCSDVSAPVLGGLDLVSFMKDGKKEPKWGNPSYKVLFPTDFGDFAFYFSSGKHKDMFKEDPQKYIPLFGGFDAIGMSRMFFGSEQAITTLGPSSNFKNPGLFKGKLFFHKGTDTLEWSNLDRAQRNWMQLFEEEHNTPLNTLCTMTDLTQFAVTWLHMVEEEVVEEKENDLNAEVLGSDGELGGALPENEDQELVNSPVVTDLQPTNDVMTPDRTSVILSAHADPESAEIGTLDEKAAAPIPVARGGILSPSVMTTAGASLQDIPRHPMELKPKMSAEEKKALAPSGGEAMEDGIPSANAWADPATAPRLEAAQLHISTTPVSEEEAGIKKLLLDSFPASFPTVSVGAEPSPSTTTGLEGLLRSIPVAGIAPAVKMQPSGTLVEEGGMSALSAEFDLAGIPIAGTGVVSGGQFSKDGSDNPLLRGGAH